MSEDRPVAARIAGAAWAASMLQSTVTAAGDGRPVAAAVLAIGLVPIVRSREETVMQAQHRVRIRPGMRRPAQTRSYWTIDSSRFDDDRLYRP